MAPEGPGWQGWVAALIFDWLKLYCLVHTHITLRGAILPTCCNISGRDGSFTLHVVFELSLINMMHSVHKLKWLRQHQAWLELQCDCD
jgi:hypothetical protein